MKRFVDGIDRTQSTLFPERLEDWIREDNPVRVVDVFVDELDLGGLGFGRVQPRATGRPSYHPCDPSLKIHSSSRTVADYELEPRTAENRLGFASTSEQNHCSPLARLIRVSS